MEMIPLFKPYIPEQLPELDAILHSGTLVSGSWNRAFEERFIEFTGSPWFTSTNSYNSAMLVALGVIGTQPGDEIIASPVSCLASNQPFATTGIRVVWADVDPGTGLLDPESVRSRITTRTKAIFHNHFCGYVGNIEEINSIGKEFGISVVDDAIEAFGATYRNRLMGDTGTDMTVFSFQTVRIPNTIDGGGIAFNRREQYEKALLIKDYGIDRRRFRDQDGEIDPKCDIIYPGYGACMNEVNSYIGFVQMKHVSSLLERQRKNAENWKQVLKLHYPEVETIPSYRGSHPNYWILGILVPNKKQYLSIFRSKGFYASSVHLPNNLYAVFKDHPDLKGSREFYSKFLALPSGWWIDEININDE